MTNPIATDVPGVSASEFANSLLRYATAGTTVEEVEERIQAWARLVAALAEVPQPKDETDA